MKLLLHRCGHSSCGGYVWVKRPRNWHYGEKHGAILHKGEYHPFLMEWGFWRLVKHPSKEVRKWRKEFRREAGIKP